MKPSIALISLSLLIIAGSARAELKEARVTQIVQDVKILPGQASARPAIVNDRVDGGTAVRTGVESRTELTFADLSIARLGANTVFSFDRGARAIDLGSGAVLLRVPKNSGGATINTAAVTAAITGTTVIAEYNCPAGVQGERATCPDALFKFITLEGTMRVCKNGSPNECVNLGPGQMLVGRANQPFSEPVDIDVTRLLATSLLIQGFPPLPSQDLMEASARLQLEEKTSAQLVDSSTHIFGSGKLYALNDPVPEEVIDQRFAAETAPSPSPSVSPTPRPSPSPSATPTPVPTPSPSPSASPTPVPTPSPSPSASPTPVPTPSPSPSASPAPIPTPRPSPSASPTPVPTPSPSPSASPTPNPTPTPSPTPQPTPQKFGTPPVITSTNLSVIDGGTVIQTDPTVSRNGEVGEGRIYRSPAEDGPFSAWAFTATSAFDTASGIDAHFGNAANLQIAAFKFTLLTLLDDPTISTANGGTTKLALISIGNLTNSIGQGGFPQVTGTGFRFLGLDTLLLATQNGSILFNGGAFDGIAQLYFYARGLASDLILGASVSGTNLAILQAERDVRIDAPLSANEFVVFANRDFLNGTGAVRSGVIDIRAGNNVNFLLSQFAVGAAFDQTVNLFAGNAINADVRTDQSVFARAGSIRLEANTINFFGAPGAPGETITFERNPTVTFIAGTGGFLAQTVSFDHLEASNPFNIASAGEILLRGIVGVDNLTAATSFRASEQVITLTLTTGTFIDAASDLNALSFVSAGSTINAGGELTSPLVQAGGNVSAQTVRVLALEAPLGVLTAGSGGIVPFFNSEGAAAQHTFTIVSVVSPSTGIDFSGNQFEGRNNDFSGGRLTIFANTLRFDAEIGLGAVNFNGADGFGFAFSPASGRGGDGGIFILNALGDIFVGENISATTGLNDPNNGNAPFGGAGGQVTLETSGGMLTVNSTIQVSSNDPTPSPSEPPVIRRSESGGDITLHSGLTTGTAITLNNTSRLLSLLADGAAGPGGTIRVLSDGGDIFANGEITADRGTIIISNLPPAAPGNGGVSGPLISIDGSFASLTAETLRINSAGRIEFGLNSFVFLQVKTFSLIAATDIIGGDLFTSEAVFASSGNVTVQAGQAISFSGAIRLFRDPSLAIASVPNDGLNITLTAGTSLSTGSDLRLGVSGGMVSGGNVTVGAGGDIDIGGVFDIEIFGTGTSGQNMAVTAGGSLTAGEIFLLSLVDTRSNGILNSGSNILLQTGGDLVLDDARSGNGDLVLDVVNSGQQIINGANIDLLVGGSLRGLPANSSVLNIFLENDISVRPTPGVAGRITTGGNVNVAIGSNLDLSSATSNIETNGAGTRIETGGNTTFTVGGNVTLGEFFALDLNNRDAFIGTGGNIDLNVTGNVGITGRLFGGTAFRLRIENVGGSIGMGGNVTAIVGGNLTTANLLMEIDNRGGGVITTGGIIQLTVSGNLVTPPPPAVAFPNGNILGADADFRIFLSSGGLGPFPNGAPTGPAIVVRADSLINIAGSLNAFIDDSNGFGAPSGLAGPVQVSSGGTINLLNRLNVLGSVIAGGAITAGTIVSTDVSSGTSIGAGFGGIQQFELPSNSARPGVIHVLTAASVTSQGGIFFDGSAAGQAFSNATDGGALTLNADSLLFGTGGIEGSVTLNGGDGSSDPMFSAAGGGTLLANTTGDITVNSDIEATSGLVNENLNNTSGNGGTVTLNSSAGTVSGSSRIEVSSGTVFQQQVPAGSPSPTPRPLSDKGGNIKLTSGRAGNSAARAVAINVANTSQLLALLDASATGPGGKITIEATGANSDVNLNGRSQADRGTIDVRHQADGGHINIGGNANSGNRATLSADVIKAGAFGANGQLNIGSSTLSASNLIRLYATGSNGELNFIANTSLSGNRIDLAANRITIQPFVVVFISGGNNPANVYTNDANYSGVGGSNSNNGTFGGNGANMPQPLSAAPPFDSPPLPPAPATPVSGAPPPARGGL